MSITVDAVQAKEALVECLTAHLTPFLQGSPGIGKSAIIKAIAKEYNLKLIDVRLSQCDPTDLLGFPQVQDNRASYAPMTTFPIEGDEIPEGYDGWLVFFDEINSAPMSVQAAAYKIVLDRQIGEYNMHYNCVVMCAGNKETDNAIVNRLSTAMQSRMVHLELEVTSKAFIEYCHQAGIDHRVASYIEFRPDAVYNFDPNHHDKTYACPRTWEFASKLMSKWSGETISQSKVALLAGTLGEGTAREFIAFTKVYRELPKIKDIVKNPDNISFNDEPSVMYALSGSIAANADKSNIEPLMRFLRRLPAEFQYISLRSAVKRNAEILELESVRKWVTEASIAHF